MTSPTPNRGKPEHGFQQYRPFFIEIFGTRWGFEYSRVGRGSLPYLDRYILYAFGGTVRLHKFWRGDDDRAPHDHPWWFITFPFTSYYEKVPGGWWYEGCGLASPRMYYKLVKAWRFHFRPAKYQHIVYGREPFVDGKLGNIYRRDYRPFWTFVITGGKSNDWGFWPKPEVFVGYRDWSQYVKEHNL